MSERGIDEGLREKEEIIRRLERRNLELKERKEYLEGEGEVMANRIRELENELFIKNS